MMSDITDIMAIDGNIDFTTYSGTIGSYGIKMHAITQNESGRPDIVSNMYYSTPEYWWAILLKNNIGYGFSMQSCFKIYDDDIESKDQYNKTGDRSMMPIMFSDFRYGMNIMIPSIESIREFMSGGAS